MDEKPETCFNLNTNSINPAVIIKQEIPSDFEDNNFNYNKASQSGVDSEHKPKPGLLINEVVIKEECFISDEDYIRDNECNILDHNREGGGFAEKNSTQLTVEDGFYDVGQHLVHEVFIKEEIPDGDNNSCSSTVLQPSTNIPLEEQSFGNHFLAPCFESQYQYANGQSAEVECYSKSNELLSLPAGNYTQNRESGPASSSFPYVQQGVLCSSSNDTCQTKSLKNYKKKQNSTVNVPVWQNLPTTTEIREDFKSEIVFSNTKDGNSLLCQFCSYQTPNKYTLRQHILNRHSFGCEPIECPYCKRKSLSIMEIEDHISTSHLNRKVNFKEKKYHCCSLCDYKNSKIGNIAYHMAAKHTLQKDFVCPFCEYKCITDNNMKRHVWKIHRKRVNNVSTIKISNKVKS